MIKLIFAVSYVSFNDGPYAREYINVLTRCFSSSSTMTERPRDLGDFKGRVTLRLNFRLKGYVSRQWPLDRGMVMWSSSALLVSISLGLHRLLTGSVHGSRKSGATPTIKGREFTQFHSTNYAKIAKNVQLLRIGSRPRAFERAIDGVRTLPLLPPKGGSKSDFV